MRSPLTIAIRSPCCVTFVKGRLITAPERLLLTIPFILQITALLAAFTYPSHIVIYAPGDAFICRRAAI
ncbi:hypothetical protein EAE89_09465 [Photorhabdus heterorhabditis]|nr:hypothetical protein [Photorhabdus heterorhabditis]